MLPFGLMDENIFEIIYDISSVNSFVLALIIFVINVKITTE